MVKVHTPHATPQTVNRFVGNANRLFLVFVGEDDQHRTKNFFPCQGVVGLNTQHRGLHKIAFIKSRFVGTTSNEFGALLQALADKAQHTLALSGADQGSKAGVLVQARA